MDGAALRALRTRYRLTQAAVAAAAGIAQPDLSAMEHDRRGTPESRARVAEAIRRLVRPSDVLSPQTRDAVRAIFSEHGASDVRIFGSVARGKDRPGSDLDLIAVFPDDFGFLELMELEDELEQVTGLPIDVVSDSPHTAASLVRAKRDAVPL